MKKKFKFQVYYTGNNFTLKDKVDKFKSKFKEKFDTVPEIELISISENPESAEANNILVAPTILRTFPEPRIKIVGGFPRRNDTWNKIVKE